MNNYPIVDRQYIRHPSTIPLEYAVTDIPECYTMEYVQNVSLGGLSFHANSFIEPQKWIHLYIPIDENYFEADAQVRWCEPTGEEGHYDIGVSFNNPHEAFSARMVEQVCYIEQYRQTIKEREGRELTSDQAAAEWIAKYANDFPTAEHS